jgi:hypothetical protein
MSNRRRVHWLAPTTILTSFFVGCLLTFVRHEFYNSFAKHHIALAMHHLAGHSLPPLVELDWASSRLDDIIGFFNIKLAGNILC